MKTLLKISLIATIVLTIISCESKTPSQTTNNRPERVIEKPDQSEAEKPTATEEATNSEDSIKRKCERELEQEREGYAKEQARFAKVLSEASDEELFVVLNYAIAQHYVPNREIDPFLNMFVMVGHWQRSLMVYNNLSDRKDLLKKIYPDLKVLDEYVKWRRHGEPYTDTIVSKAILKNAKENSQKMDYKLKEEFFSTPLMHY